MANSYYGTNAALQYFHIGYEAEEEATEATTTEATTTTTEEAIIAA